MRRKIVEWMLLICIVVFFVAMWSGKVVEKARMERLDEDVALSTAYREQRLSEEMLSFLKEKKNVGTYAGLYLLESKFGYEAFRQPLEEKTFIKLKEKWEKQEGFSEYTDMTKAIWDEVKFFPVAEMTGESGLTVSYVDSWMTERTYGGKRGHEGTDIMASKNERGLYPVLSMTDGTVAQMGWLEKGGYRIGITTTSGVYFYYAHLDSYADLKVGDSVNAGDILGYMGDSGYGEEGTVGQFPVHLHLGIYIYPNGEEISINPYWLLRYIENKKVKCYTEV